MLSHRYCVTPESIDRSEYEEVALSLMDGRGQEVSMAGERATPHSRFQHLRRQSL